jgi:hypothetical protein
MPEEERVGGSARQRSGLEGKRVGVSAYRRVGVWGIRLLFDMAV